MSSYLLLETGDRLLQENGSLILTIPESVGSATGSATATALSLSIGTATGACVCSGVAKFESFRRAILNGLDSAQSEAAGWDALKGSIPESAVVRTSGTVVTITLTALGSYDITADETITATVPAVAVTSGVPAVATPTIVVTATASGNVGSTTGSSTVTATGQSTALATGSATGSASVAGVALGVGASTGASTVTATGQSTAVATGSTTGSCTVTAAASGTSVGSATGVATVTGVAKFESFRRALLNGLDSAQSEAAGWDAIKTSIPESAVVRTSATVVTITLPALGSYDITANETLTDTVPAAVLTGGNAIVATPTVQITATVSSGGRVSDMMLMGVGG